MRYFLDTEFDEQAGQIGLISIGIVREDGKELYLQACDFWPWEVSPWVREHVFPGLLHCPHIQHALLQQDDTSLQGNAWAHLKQCVYVQPASGIVGSHGIQLTPRLEKPYPDCFWRSRREMAQEIQAFIDPQRDPHIDLVAWCGSYDHVALCQLYGGMMKQPAGWPHHILDFQWLLQVYGIKDEELPPQETGLHNALHDARHLRRLWDLVNSSDWRKEARRGL